MMPKDPIIIIGMHRSGTTMIADLLQQLGLYLGWVLQENSEALFFVERNEKLMNVCGGGWEHPESVVQLLDNSDMRAHAARQLQRDMASVRFFSYLGPNKMSHLGGPHKLDFPWGWKDPRNSYLLPLWLDLFPNAKIIHIHRHPMDVALSLQTRESKSVQKRLQIFGGNGFSEMASKFKRPSKESLLLFGYRKACSAISRLDSLEKYTKFSIASTVSLDAGLQLWCSYVQKCVDNLSKIKNPSLTIKYEDFLSRPGPYLEELSKFCGLPVQPNDIPKLCSTLRIERRYAFSQNPEHVKFFETVKDHPLVKRFGYDSINN